MSGALPTNDTGEALAGLRSPDVVMRLARTIADLDGAVGHIDGIQPRGAQAIEGHRRDLDGKVGQQSCHARFRSRCMFDA